MASILVIDDNAVTRKLVRFALQSTGYAVLEAEDGRSALELIEESVPDLVLQDLRLPDMDGFALVSQLQERLDRGRVPILALSGFVSTAELARTAAVGFDDVIVKPVEAERLVQIVRAHLRRPVMDAEDRFGDGRRLVLVDDDPLQTKLALFKLVGLGFRVETAADGMEALEKARLQRPDIIVSDIMMPNVDGFQLCMEARRDSFFDSVPIILVTSSYADEADRALAEEVGADAYVIRTPNFDEVTSALRRALTSQKESVLPRSSNLANLERGHAERVIRQLERQVLINAGISQRCSVLSAEISILSGISRALSQSESLDDSIDDVLSTLLDAGDIATGALLIFEKDEVRARSAGSNEIWSDATLQSFFGDLPELHQRLASGAPILFPNDEQGLSGVRSALSVAGLESALIVPLVCQGELVGALFLTSPSRSMTEQDRVSFVVSASAQISQGIGLVRAFAAQAEATRRAQESEATLRSMIRSTADGIVVADEQGRVLYWNPAAESLLPGLPGVTDAREWQKFGLHFADRVTPFPPEQLPLMRAIRGERVTPVELYARRAEGAAGAWLSVNAQPFVGADGRRRGGVAVIRDVTTDKAAREQLMISDRMASVGMLAAGVAHEINNPLTAVLANIEFAMKKVELLSPKLGTDGPVAELNEALSDAVDAATRVQQIVRDLKMLSRAEDDVRSVVDVERVIDSTLRIAWNEIRHRANLVTDYGHVPGVDANESRLGQVFLNLVVNAAQAIPEGHADTNQIRVTTRVDGAGRVVVEIADTGSGIPEHVLGSLFKPFFTTKPAGIGTGLGLAICQRIVTGLGGEIGVDTEVGVGTTFRVSLPAAAGAKESARPLPPPSPCPRSGRILLVDDDAMVAGVVRRVLSPDHEVEVLTSARDALALIASGERFDVILCDMMMPVVTGAEFYDELTRIAADQAERVVFLTGGAFTARARKFLERVSNPRLDKPFDARVLRAVVNERLG